MRKQSLIFIVAMLILVVSVSAWACSQDPPGGGIDRPGLDGVVSGTTDVTLNVTSGSAITSVDILVDGKAVDTLKPESDDATSATFTYSWDTTKVANGEHTISATAHAYDRVDGTLEAVTVTVRNEASADTN